MDAMHDRTIALADCNNFFVSCERLICPELRDRPLVVLSGNDGCVISRSNEVKRMGIKMGEPYFKIRGMLANKGVAVRSTNMKLYRQVSAEVIARLKLYTDAAEVYSIDESFLNIAIATVKDPVLYCRGICSDILKNCGIPVSVGIAPTKTLAKLAADYAKKEPGTGGVFWADMAHYQDHEFMEHFKCGDIWGIGWRTAQKLAYYGINTAADFASCDDIWMRRIFGINGLYCLWEIRGKSVYPIMTARKPQKSIMVSRSFGTAVTDHGTLLDALLCFTASAAVQLRKSGLSASRMDIFITTSRFAQEKRYANSCGTDFAEPARIGADLMSAAAALLSEIFIEGYDYKKCGVILSKLSDISTGRQTQLFNNEDRRRIAAEAAADAVNRWSGSQMVKPAVLFDSPENHRKWTPRSEFRSGPVKSVRLPDGLRFQSHAEDLI